MSGRDAPGAASPLVSLARSAIEKWVRERKVLDPGPRERLPEELRERAGAFVSLKKGGELRGCIGTFQPTRDNLAEEIVSNAISAATRDPRFPPVSPEELPDLEISVDVLSEPEPVEDISQLDPRRFGVIVQSGGRLGLLLPDLEGVDTVEQQLDIARRKAGIGQHEPIHIYRFTVRRHH
ncbi:AmmeMemoRadiSam system protein A [Candidatus Solincola tengchongensis]|uniref:AmmeMemoRadiSam system protein A n=1 Tax=Candidatus Solincola tengchongensis TaxID=2900693 RepID=UPI00257978CA|nr:AmmeMemoRadiSam system protein A [Candidatus Solincola tengchongensis]